MIVIVFIIAPFFFDMSGVFQLSLAFLKSPFWGISMNATSEKILTLIKQYQEA